MRLELPGDTGEHPRFQICPLPTTNVPCNVGDPQRRNCRAGTGGANREGEYLFVDAVPHGERATDSYIKKWGDRIGKAGRTGRHHGREQRTALSHEPLAAPHVRALVPGQQTENIAMSIGDTVKTVADHYSRPPGYTYGDDEGGTQAYGQHCRSGAVPLPAPEPVFRQPALTGVLAVVSLSLLPSPIQSRPYL